MEGKAGDSAGANGTELTNFVQGLLQQMRSRFDKMSDNIIARVDEMGGRIDELEKSISELLEQAGGEPPHAAGQVQPAKK